jgi:hypothetical protein
MRNSCTPAMRIISDSLWVPNSRRRDPSRRPNEICREPAAPHAHNKKWSISWFVGAGVTTGFVDHRLVKRLAFAVVAAAVWLVGAGSSAHAGCGDYLVGVDQGQNHQTAPMTPDHDVPQCRSCNQPASPIPPVVQPERLPVEHAVPEVGSSMILDRGGWERTDFSPRCQVLSFTPDRPPKI